MILASTLTILKKSQEEWQNLSLPEQIKWVRRTIRATHPDRNDGKNVEESQELIEFYKYLKTEDNHYLSQYTPPSERTTPAFTSARTHSSGAAEAEAEPVETAQEFFSAFKKTTAKQFKHDWNQAFLSSFIVENPHYTEELQGEFRSFASPSYFHISRLVQEFKLSKNFPSASLKKDHIATEENFDQALECIYYLIRYEKPYDSLIPLYILPPCFLENRVLSLKILSFFPEIVSVAQCHDFPGFWKEQQFWSDAIKANTKIFDVFYNTRNRYPINRDHVLNKKLSTQFNDKRYMLNLITRNPTAVYWLGDSLNNDIEILTQAIDGLSYSNHAVKKLINSLPNEMRAIDSLLAKKVLQGDGLFHLAAFENTNSPLYFSYLHQACYTLDSTRAMADIIWSRPSERQMFIETLSSTEQAYAHDFCTLLNKLDPYFNRVNDKIKVHAYYFFPHKLHANVQAVAELKKLMMGTGNIADLNRVLPALKTSVLGPEIAAWLAHKTLNPMLLDIQLEPVTHHYEQARTFVTAKQTQAMSVLALGYLAGALLLYPSLPALLLLSAIAVLCAFIIDKTIRYDMDDRNFVTGYAFGR